MFDRDFEGDERIEMKALTTRGIEGYKAQIGPPPTGNTIRKQRIGDKKVDIYLGLWEGFSNNVFPVYSMIPLSRSGCGGGGVAGSEGGEGGGGGGDCGFDFTMDCPKKAKAHDRRQNTTTSK